LQERGVGGSGERVQFSLPISLVTASTCLE
jgi:hypothetical protein